MPPRLVLLFVEFRLLRVQRSLIFLAIVRVVFASVFPAVLRLVPFYCFVLAFLAPALQFKPQSYAFYRADFYRHLARVLFYIAGFLVGVYYWPLALLHAMRHL